MSGGRGGEALVRGLGLLLAGAVVVALSSCGLTFFDRWDGEPVMRWSVPAAPDAVWNGVDDGLDAVGLAVEEIRPGERWVQFGWVTAPGDGRLYLRCAGNAPVGSASLRLRLHVRPSGTGSEVVVSTETRATGARRCASNGQFERWLLRRFGPSMSAVVDRARPRPAAAPDG